MKKILLVIFSFAIVICLIIYKSSINNKNSILLLGEYLQIDNNNINTFLYNNITYKELINSIKSNDFIIIKNKKVYLNQLIYKSNMIIINANNKEYEKRCKKGNIYNYNYFTNNNLEHLINIIKRISNSKIIVINNNCHNKTIKYKLSDNKNVLFINKKDIIKFIDSI